MDRITLSSILILSMAVVSRAEAQQGASTAVQTEPAQPTQVITTLPNESAGTQGYPQARGYEQIEFEEANRGIRNTRNALIATSGLALVGVIVASTAARHCELFYQFNQPDDLVCTQRGDALITAGASIFGLAAVGMITSGIMLGVRKGKRRRQHREMQSQRGARLQWNVESARLEF